MADILKTGLPSVCSQLPPHGHRIPFDGIDGVTNCVGETIEAGDACCVRADGTVWRQDGVTAAKGANASFHGLAPISAIDGEPISLVWGERFGYGSGLTTGRFLYASRTTRGRLDYTAPYTGALPIAFVVNPETIQVLVPYDGNPQTIV